MIYIVINNCCRIDVSNCNKDELSLIINCLSYYQDIKLERILK